MAHFPSRVPQTSHRCDTLHSPAIHRPPTQTIPSNLLQTSTVQPNPALPVRPALMKLNQVQSAICDLRTIASLSKQVIQIIEGVHVNILNPTAVLKSVGRWVAAACTCICGGLAESKMMTIHDNDPSANTDSANMRFVFGVWLVGVVSIGLVTLLIGRG